jgi:chlorobactene glucosyltransferase
MLIYQVVVLLSLLVFFAILLRNLVDLPALPEDAPYSGPFVSVLVPARNEALNIERCVRSLLQQDYLSFEIVVLDDASTDATPELLRTLVEESGERLKVMTGAPLPDGWHGKAWACHQLSRQAKGELLLFTDADTMHDSRALRRSVAAMQSSRADMLSLTPHQELCSFWEELVVPLVYVILMCYLPLRLVRTSRNPAFCFANGQFILFQRALYDRINGHAAVRQSIAEDVWLCKAIKRAGGTVVAFNGSDAVSCRMYRSLGAIWEGFSKNLFAGLGYSSPGLFLLMALTLLFYILPYLFFSQALLSGEFSTAMFWLPLIQILLALLSRLIIARLFRQSLPVAMLHLFSEIFLLAIALNSFWIIKFGKGAKWKGRTYNFSSMREDFGEGD